MVRLFIALFAATLVTQAHATEIDPVKCAADATAALPKSPILVVKDAATRHMTPTEAKEYPTGLALWVDVDVALSGRETRYTYVCAITRAGRVVRETTR